MLWSRPQRVINLHHLKLQAGDLFHPLTRRFFTLWTFILLQKNCNQSINKNRCKRANYSAIFWSHGPVTDQTVVFYELGVRMCCQSTSNSSCNSLLAPSENPGITAQPSCWDNSGFGRFNYRLCSFVGHTKEQPSRVHWGWICPHILIFSFNIVALCLVDYIVSTTVMWFRCQTWELIESLWVQPVLALQCHNFWGKIFVWLLLPWSPILKPYTHYCALIQYT